MEDFDVNINGHKFVEINNGQYTKNYHCKNCSAFIKMDRYDFAFWPPGDNLAKFPDHQDNMYKILNCDECVIKNIIE